MVCALVNLGHELSDETLGNILRHHGIAPAHRGSTQRPGTSSFVHTKRCSRVLTSSRLKCSRQRGLVSYYVLFFIHLESRRVEVAGITPHPNEAWMQQVARNVTVDERGCFDECRYLIHDRDTKYCDSLRQTIKSGGIEPLRLPARSPDLNAFAERWVKAGKDECLSKLLFFGENSLRRALQEYMVHYHGERNHQGKDNVVLFPVVTAETCNAEGTIACRERLGGLLKYYHRDAG